MKNQFFEIYMLIFSFLICILLAYVIEGQMQQRKLATLMQRDMVHLSATQDTLFNSIKYAKCREIGRYQGMNNNEVAFLECPK